MPRAIGGPRAACEASRERVHAPAGRASGHHYLAQVPRRHSQQHSCMLGTAEPLLASTYAPMYMCIAAISLCASWHELQGTAIWLKSRRTPFLAFVHAGYARAPWASTRVP